MPSDAKVYIILTGEKGETDKIFLTKDDIEPSGCLFKPGDVDEFSIQTTKIGEPSSIIIGTFYNSASCRIAWTVKIRLCLIYLVIFLSSIFG